MKHKNILVASSYTLITALFAILFFDLVFDDSYDSFLSNITTFQFTPFSLYDLHYLCILLVKDILKFIQNILPTIPVFASSYIVLNILSLFYFLYSLKSLSLNRNKLITHLFLVVISVLFIENIVSITHTRFASVFTGMALLNLLAKENNLKNFSIHSCVFLFGFLIRPESGVGSILIVSIAFFLFDFNLSRYLKSLFIPVSLVVIFIISLSIHKKYTDRFEILIEPDIEYAISTGRIQTLSEMNTKEDSLRYKMAVNAIFIDTDFVNVSFLRRITAKQFELSFEKFNNSVLNISDHYRYYPVFYILFLIIFIFVLLKKEYLLGLKLIVYQLFIFFLLIYLDYNVSVAERHFIGVNLVVFAIYIASFYRYIKRSKFWFAVPLLIFGTYTSYENAMRNQSQVYKDVECLEENMHVFESVFQNYTVIVSLNSVHLLDRNFEIKNKTYGKNQYLLYDAVTYSMVPRNLNFLSNICKCNSQNAAEFLKWALEEELVFLMNNERYKLIEEYMLLVHKEKVVFVAHEKSELFIRAKCTENIVLEPFIPKVLKYNLP